jgi:threonine/homoserine/homoserine lactone efflux protein
MTTSTTNHSDFFYSALAAVAIIAPILLVIAAGTLPEGLDRGELIVYGHGVVLAVLATALVLRASYILGFNQALQKLQTRRRITQVTA